MIREHITYRYILPVLSDEVFLVRKLWYPRTDVRTIKFSIMKKCILFHTFTFCIVTYLGLFSCLKATGLLPSHISSLSGDIHRVCDSWYMLLWCGCWAHFRNRYRWSIMQHDWEIMQHGWEIAQPCTHWPTGAWLGNGQFIDQSLGWLAKYCNWFDVPLVNHAALGKSCIAVGYHVTSCIMVDWTRPLIRDNIEWLS